MSTRVKDAHGRVLARARGSTFATCRKWGSLVPALAVAMVVGACNIVAPVAYLIEGPPKLDAQHTLADVPTVVFIDDRSNLVNPVSLRRTMGDAASQDLMAKGVLKSTISSHDAMTLASRTERNSHILSIEEIGKSVGAQQVIYVQVRQFALSPDGFTPRPTAACDVRVIDVEKRERTFPPPDAGESARSMQAMIREVDLEQFNTRAGRLKIFESLAVETGERIAKMFYRHEPRELGGNLKPR